MPRILIVDPSVENSETLSDLFEMSGFKACATSTGAQALSVLRDGVGVDAVVSELLLPDIDGLSLFRTMADDDGLRSLPFIVASATTATTMGLDVPARIATFLKPYRFGDLLEAIEAALEGNYHSGDAPMGIAAEHTWSGTMAQAPPE